jgi:hypothetical protein
LTWTNYATEIKIVTGDTTVQYGELIETYERAKTDTWDTYELISWEKPKWEIAGQCEHTTAAGASRWFNICPRLTMNPAWCATANGCTFYPATMSQYLSECRWVPNDQSYNFVTGVVVTGIGFNSNIPLDEAML